MNEVDAGLRLDVFLARRVDGWSRRKANDAIAAGAVRVNGRRSRKGLALSSGDLVAFEESRYDLQANPELRLRILFEDDSLIAVDKPPGIPSVALRPDETQTVANFLLAVDQSLRAVGGSLEAGLVHRLDTGTSGVVLAARTAPAYEDLRRQFQDRTVLKEYVAVVEGDVARSGTRKSRLVHGGKHGHKMREVQTDERGAQLAITTYEPLERFGSETLLALRIETGLMHQIRAHMAALGHPVVGDALYGSRVEAPRPLLHAAKLAFSHPLRAGRVEIESGLPVDLVEHLKAMRLQG
ncbi:MAG TPA: RluA family pseudouridine synthase [Candidatus Acidoferrales bacterium]|nr:RluA family pseudouridine synthase [Candidatus Acidoferrales bacterium]